MRKQIQQIRNDTIVTGNLHKSTGNRSSSSLIFTDKERRLIELKRNVVNAIKRNVPSIGGSGLGKTSTASASAIQGEQAEDPDNSLVSVDIELRIKEFSYYRAVLHVSGSVSTAQTIRAIGYFNESDDPIFMVTIPDNIGRGTCQFEFDIEEARGEIALTTALAFQLDSGRIARVNNPAEIALSSDPVAKLYADFRSNVSQQANCQILEVGSRARSGNVYRDWLSPGATYTGFDILPGPNVDVVGDAHQLSTFFEEEKFDAIICVSTVEHLAMPWVVAAEMGRVLKVGGYVYVGTHQTWPVHDEPWDFFRFSEYAWQALFNEFSGFEIIATAAGEPGKVVANVLHRPTDRLEYEPAFLGSAVLARKIGPTQLVWAADPQKAVAGYYPE
jgi:SAM-dependent methyltransferase